MTETSVSIFLLHDSFQKGAKGFFKGTHAKGLRKY
jgi:hypothetical protein